MKHYPIPRYLIGSKKIVAVVKRCKNWLMNVALIDNDLVEADRHLTVEDIASEMGISVGSIHTIISKHFNLNKKYRSVIYLLTKDTAAMVKTQFMFE